MEKTGTPDQIGNVNLDTLGSRIDKNTARLARIENLSKATLSVLSRDLLLFYLNGSKDIGKTNRVLLACTPRNGEMSAIFFSHFLPWKYDEKKKGFTTMKGDKKVKECFEAIEEFLADPAADVWTWAEAQGLKVGKDPAPFADRIRDLVKQALNGTNRQEAIGPADIIKAVMAAGISVDDAMSAMAASEEQVEEAEQAQAA